MADLPQSFLDSMKEILEEDYEAFLAGFDGQRQVWSAGEYFKDELGGIRKNCSFSLKKVPWISNGYFYEAEDVPAKHPFYSAGLYYLQEPSAMTPASRLKVQPGERVLDLCAAPGGKATELGAALQGEGLLVANDINTARARALLRNLELFGISNSFVTNEPPHVLAERFPEFFTRLWWMRLVLVKECFERIRRLWIPGRKKDRNIFQNCSGKSLYRRQICCFQAA